MSGVIEGMLRRIPLFSGLADTELAPLALRCRRRLFPSREALFHEGDAGQTLYLILSGHVNIQRETPDGSIVHVARRGPGDHFGELSLFDDLPRSADALTDTACDLLMLDRRELLFFLETHPQVSWAIIRTLSSRLREASDRMVSSETRDVLARLAACLLESAEAGTPDTRGHIRLDGLSDGRLAQRIGATRETVNRRLSRLKQMGVLRRDGTTLIVQNTERLRTLC
ncbi:Crp/Fnr family transcriptional regulator [Armatimonas sp.]|uniref:Crp/Fnr family transcriptional regulator n=1 Tax=Armatimonas sp. TaxID=1872638 RepID=UPI0037529C87